MKTKRILILFATIIASLLTSCVSYQFNGIKPISPSVSLRWGMGGISPTYPAHIDDLQPTLSWNCVELKEVKYDVVIYEGVRQDRSPSIDTVPYYAPGKEVYHYDGVEGCSHHVEKPLQTDTVYVWSVRIHDDTYKEAWSTYDFIQGIPPTRMTARLRGQNMWFSFITPYQQ